MPLVDLDALPLGRLFAALCPPDEIDLLVETALAEDLGDAGDITTEAMHPSRRVATGMITARAAGVVCGCEVAARVFALVPRGAEFHALVGDGTPVRAGQPIARVEGDLAAILAGERTALNFLGFLGGISTLTAKFVEAVAGTKARIVDTRKTLPGLRRLSKYAVRCGGGSCHRLGLCDAFLAKDNHAHGLDPAAYARAVAAAGAIARGRHGARFVEAEADSFAQVEALLALPAGSIDIILLDNMDPDRLAEAVALRDHANPAVLLEASGGVRRTTVRAVALAGVDRIAIGALTHSAPTMDVGLDLL